MAGKPPPTQATSGDHVLRYDPELRGPNTVRVRRIDGTLRYAVDALVKIGEAKSIWVAFVAREFSRGVEGTRTDPVLVRAGSGDGTQWQVPPCRDLEERHPDLPRGSSFLLVGCPGEWP